MRAFAATALLSILSLCQAQPPPPDLSDVAYGPHERNTLDLWKAQSPNPTPLIVFIYGGGFVQGDKKNVSKLLVVESLRRGISVAAINYRYSTQAPYPAPMLDGAHAIQFLRLHAADYHLNPRAFGATGGSAGAGISLWIGFHDDIADPHASDPMARQSTRLAAVAVTAAQTSYDPRTIDKLIGGPTARIDPLRKLFAVPADEDMLTAKEKFALYEDASPITHLKAGAPPVFLFYPQSNTPLPPTQGNIGIHHPRFGYFLKEKMDKLGIECIVRVKEDYDGAPPGQVQRDIVDFFARHF